LTIIFKKWYSKYILDLCQFRFNIHKFTGIWPRETVIKVLLTATGWVIELCRKL